MNLIDRYVSEIGKRLPRKVRTDIEAEIRSTLDDMLEERIEKAGRPADEEMIKELLKEYGAPDKVAAAYLPEQYLIGPKLFPIFWLVLKIVGSVLTVLAVIGFGIRFGMSAQTIQAFGTQLGKTIAEYFGGIVSAFGNIVLIFAILERALPKSEYENELNEGWDPAELTKEPEPDEIHTWEPILAIAFTLAGLLIFNLYPQVIQFGFVKDGQWNSVPALSDAFFRMLPWINISWILGIGLQIMLLRQGKWTPLTRWFDIGLRIISIVIAYLLLKGPSILALTTADLAKISIEPSSAATLISLLNAMIAIALSISILVGGIEVVRNIYKMLIRPAIAKPVVIH